MVISTLYKKGVYHSNHNEDNFLFEKEVQGKCIMAVMDGCSTAVESYWTSGLIRKILLQSIQKIKNSESLMTLDGLGMYLFQEVFDQTKLVKSALDMDEIELFSTLLIATIDPMEKTYAVFQSGDGLFSVEGKHHILNANNVPDFFAYHLEKTFSDFYSNHVTVVQGSLENRFLLSTDGIEKMNDLNRSFSSDWLLKNGLLRIMGSKIYPKALEDTYELLRKEHQIYPLDDIAIIALELDQEA